MHGNDDTPIWDFAYWAVPTVILGSIVFMAAVLIGSYLRG